MARVDNSPTCLFLLFRCPIPTYLVVSCCPTMLRARCLSATRAAPPIAIGSVWAFPNPSPLFPLPDLQVPLSVSAIAALQRQHRQQQQQQLKPQGWHPTSARPAERLALSPGFGGSSDDYGDDIGPPAADPASAHAFRVVCINTPPPSFAWPSRKGNEEGSGVWVALSQNSPNPFNVHA